MKQEYKGLGSGWCDVPYCKEGAKWWTCSECDHCSCGTHQLFDGTIVLGCYWCRPNIWTKRYKTARGKCLG